MLAGAQGDPAKLSLALVDLSYPSLPAEDRAVLKQSLECAAIPHWFDEAILGALLEGPSREGAARLDRLRNLGVVERFPARGGDAWNVHESARLALRRAIAAEPGGRFVVLSGRAVDLFRESATPAGRIEWLYHLLCAEPEKGADTLERSELEWLRDARPEDRNALTLALEELEASRLIEGRARVQALFFVAWAKVRRGEASTLKDLADLALDLARSLKDPRATGEAQALMGDVLKARGDLAASRSAYQEYLDISRRLAEDDRGDAALQRELAVAHGRLGRVLELQEGPKKARPDFEEAREISRKLIDTDKESKNAVWQSDLAVACNDLGGVLEGQDEWAEEAREAFEEALEIRLKLVKRDPSNADWQSDLASSHTRIGGVHHHQRRFSDAEAEYKKALAIRLILAGRDPSNLDWQSKLAEAFHWLGEVMHDREDREGALGAFEESLAILRRLAELKPSRAKWQEDLVVAYNRVGRVLRSQGKPDEAVVAFERALSISRRLAEESPSNGDWRWNHAVTCQRVAQVYCDAGRFSEAEPHFVKALAILEELCRGDSGPAEKAGRKEVVQSELRACRDAAEEARRSGTPGPAGPGPLGG